MKTIIAILGNIGVGKTTLTKHLQDELSNSLLIQEPVDQWLKIKDPETGENILQRFYQDKKRWTYTFENIAFITRLMRLIEALQSDQSTIILDGSLATDKNIFAQMLHQDGFMDPLEWQAYNLWNNFYQHYVMQHRIIYVYLKTDPQIALQRIHHRGRPEEKNIKIDYLTKLDQQYEQWLQTKPLDHVLKFDCTCEETSEDYLHMIKQIIQILGK